MLGHDLPTALWFPFRFTEKTKNKNFTTLNIFVTSKTSNILNSQKTDLKEKQLKTKYLNFTVPLHFQREECPYCFVFVDKLTSTM